MNTKLLAEDLRKYTLGRQFDFKEFIKIVGMDEKEALKVLQALILDCYVRPAGKTGWKITYGESRQKYIDEKIEVTEKRIREYFAVLEHIKGLKDEKKETD